MNTWLAELAVPGRRDLHLRRLAGLPQPAQPHPGLGVDPAQRGWRLLPITLGPQASCSPRFPRYGNDETIKPKRGTNGKYRPARTPGPGGGDQCRRGRQGARHRPGEHPLVRPRGASTTPTGTAASPRCRSSAPGPTGCTSSTTSPASTPAPGPASRCSTTPASTGRTRTTCRTGSGWPAGTDGQHQHVVHPRGRLAPGGRVKQYQGGHDETWGGVRINIDRNFLDLGRGSLAAPETHCGGVGVDFPDYADCGPAPRTTDRVKALQCLLKEQKAVRRQGQRHLHRRHHRRRAAPGRRSSTASPSGHLDPAGLDEPARRRTAADPQVRLRRHRRTPHPARAERRAAATPSCRSPVCSTGATDRALRDYQRRVKVARRRRPAITLRAHLGGHALPAAGLSWSAGRPAAPGRSGRRRPTTPAAAPRGRGDAAARPTTRSTGPARLLGHEPPATWQACRGARRTCRSTIVTNGGTEAASPAAGSGRATSAGRRRPRRW